MEIKLHPILLNILQIDYMKHCIGYDYRKVKKGKYIAYRNYFDAGQKEKNWVALVSCGLAEEYDHSGCYKLTSKGIEVLETILGIKIEAEE